MDARFNGVASGLTNNEQQQQQQQQQLQVKLNAWQPLTGHNNWLILQATAATAMRQQQQPQGQLPVNYYAYNHRYQTVATAAANDAPSGNYKQVRSNLNAAAPRYVWALSPTLHQLPNGEDAPDVQRGHIEPEAREANNRVTNTYANTNAADEALDVLAKPTSATAQRINNYLTTFERAVRKVRNFCDTVRDLISGEDGEDWDEGHEIKQELRSLETNILSTKLVGRSIDAATENEEEEEEQLETATTTSKEIQGRGSQLAGSIQGRKLKKLKKKIQKLLLPLLIAYKLKFLTLIPVLIGGLTLLVGTTGLAGFFFALFTAVMSLKSSAGVGHSSKAIVLKKI
ncbi:uncharacterized protein LOC6573153 [Drosophila mojavensis]|uniref:Uncharacterized protein n=1 Tax=Drosophila mojavensis TaxID=7230 RepID=B4KBM8_DROMO|nr:uncharacterized protein LOC6573153 [Drosophila mojavensis]EDW14705.2 uncharacterized protein Dmoj_GI24401 [Drosophila mojavensis]